MCVARACDKPVVVVVLWGPKAPFSWLVIYQAWQPRPTIITLLLPPVLFIHWSPLSSQIYPLSTPTTMLSIPQHQSLYQVYRCVQPYATSTCSYPSCTLSCIFCLSLYVQVCLARSHFSIFMNTSRISLLTSVCRPRANKWKLQIKTIFFCWALWAEVV